MVTTPTPEFVTEVSLSALFSSEEGVVLTTEGFNTEFEFELKNPT